MISVRDLLPNFYLPHSQISLNALAIPFRLSIWIWVTVSRRTPAQSPLETLSNFYQACYTTFLPSLSESMQHAISPSSTCRIV